MSKNSLRSVSLMLAALLFAASHARAAEEVTLTFLVPITGNQVGAAEELSKVYMERNPHVKIDVESRAAGSEGDNIVKTRLATDTMNDLFIYNSGSLMQALRPEQTLVPLNDLPSMAVIDKTWPSVVGAGGNTYAVPFGTLQIGGFFYNKKIYADLGLSIPRTWNEFIANCEKVKEAGPAPIIQTYRTTWTSQLFILADFYNLLAAYPDFPKDYTANKAKYATTPAALRGFRMMKDVYDRGFFNADFGAATYNDGLYSLCMAEGAHYPILSHALSAMKSDIPDKLQDISVFPIPGDDPAVNGLTAWYPNGLYIPASSKNIEEAKKFADFIGGVEGSELFMKLNGAYGPSIVKGAELPDDTAPAVFDMLPYIEAGRIAPALEFLSPVKGPALEQIAIEVGTGMRSPEDAAALYDEDVRKQAAQLGLPGW